MSAVPASAAQLGGRRGRRRPDQHGHAGGLTVAEQFAECLRGHPLAARHPHQRVTVDADPAQVAGERRELGAGPGGELRGIGGQQRGRALAHHAAEVDAGRVVRRVVRWALPPGAASPQPARRRCPG